MPNSLAIASSWAWGGVLNESYCITNRVSHFLKYSPLKKIVNIFLK